MITEVEELTQYAVSVDLLIDAHTPLQARDMAERIAQEARGIPSIVRASVSSAPMPMPEEVRVR